MPAVGVEAVIIRDIVPVIKISGRNMVLIFMVPDTWVGDRAEAAKVGGWGIPVVVLSHAAFSYTSPIYRNRFGLSDAIRLVTLAALVSPPAPSPTAATIKGWPPAGLPDVGVKVFVFTGGVLVPVLKITEILACWVVKPSRIKDSTERVWVPSTHLLVGSVKVYGLE